MAGQPVIRHQFRSILYNIIYERLNTAAANYCLLLPINIFSGGEVFYNSDRAGDFSQHHFTRWYTSYTIRFIWIPNPDRVHIEDASLDDVYLSLKNIGFQSLKLR